MYLEEQEKSAWRNLWQSLAVTLWAKKHILWWLWSCLGRICTKPFLWLRSYSRFVWIPLNSRVSAFYWAWYKGQKSQTGEKNVSPVLENNWCKQKTSLFSISKFKRVTAPLPASLALSPQEAGVDSTCFLWFPVAALFSVAWRMVQGDLCFLFKRWLHLWYCRKYCSFLQICENVVW